MLPLLWAEELAKIATAHLQNVLILVLSVQQPGCG
jgi:hypothetical protein